MTPSPQVLGARGAPLSRAEWLELLLLTLLAAAAAAAVPLYAGRWSWSWDALNHHVYLGYIAEHPRWDLDVTAASVQSWQYPYLYWPVYRLSLLELSGAVAGAIWSAGLATLLLPPIWLLSRNLLWRPAGPAAQAAFERVMACALAAASVIVLAAINTTSNDPLSILPLLWALVLMSVPTPSERRVAWAAALWGAASALKLSNVLAVPLLLVWWYRGESPHWPLGRALRMAIAAFVGFVLVYAPWGWQLWRVAGHPFYPLLPAPAGH